VAKRQFSYTVARLLQKKPSNSMAALANSHKEQEKSVEQRFAPAVFIVFACVLPSAAWCRPQHDDGRAAPLGTLWQGGGRLTFTMAEQQTCSYWPHSLENMPKAEAEGSHAGRLLVSALADCKRDTQGVHNMDLVCMGRRKAHP
jgi:hypothetical protein